MGLPYIEPIHHGIPLSRWELVAPRELHHVALEDQETPGLDAAGGQRATLGQSQKFMNNNNNRLPMVIIIMNKLLYRLLIL